MWETSTDLKMQRERVATTGVVAKLALLMWRVAAAPAETGVSLRGGAFLPLCLLVVFLLSMGGISLAADKIILKNGNVIEGRIVREKGGQIIIELADAKATMGIPRSDILRIIMEKPQSFLKAEKAFKKREFREAIKLYNEVVSQYRRTEWAQKALIGTGRAYMGLKNTDEASRVFEKFLSEYKDSDLSCEVRLILGKIFRGSGEYDKARTIYAHVLERNNPEESLAEAQFSLGETYLAQEQYEDALMSFLRVVVVFGEQSEFVQKAMLRAGFCYEKIGDLANAKQIYEELMKEYPKGKYVKEARGKLNALK